MHRSRSHDAVIRVYDVAGNGSLLMLRANYFLHQRLEARIAAERIEQRINFNGADNLIVVLRDTLV